MDTNSWYQLLEKPIWAPPAWVFGPVWSLLYLLIVISFGWVALQYFKGRIPFLVFLPFVLNILFNLIFTPIQFGLKNNLLASVDILLILTTLIWAIVVIFPFVRWAALINIPYLLWVGFATALQVTITWLNRQ